MPGYVITKSLGPKPEWKPGDPWPPYVDWWGTVTAHCADCECPSLVEGHSSRRRPLSCDCRCHAVWRMVHKPGCRCGCGRPA